MTELIVQCKKNSFRIVFRKQYIFIIFQIERNNFIIEICQVNVPQCMKIHLNKSLFIICMPDIYCLI